MKELRFKTSNEVQIMKIIKDIYLSQHVILNYKVDKERDTVVFNVKKKEEKVSKVLTNTNEKR